MNRAEIEAIAGNLLAILGTVYPGQAALIGAVLPVATSLNDLLRRSREEDPAAWAAIAADHRQAWEAWDRAE